MSTIDTRRDQMFPVLDAAQVETVRRFASGPPRRFEAGEMAVRVGDRGVPSWLLLEGSMTVSRGDGLGHQAIITDYGPGQFSGEISQLAGQASLASMQAGPDGCLAAPFDSAHLRALIIGSAEVGEMVMRALILRRVALIEEGSSGSVLVGHPDEPALVRLQGFLTRNSYPVTVLDATDDAEGRAIVERLGLAEAELPLLICPNGTVLRRPDDSEAALCLGMTPELDASRIYDVAVVGAGPAGLAAAVYAASEGLSVLVLEQRAMGGQAGASARIENYLGFPTGISGQALAGRAYTQSLKFGAQVAIPLTVARLDCDDCDRDENGALKLELDNAVGARARTVVVASGARYRRPDIPRLEVFEGAGVSYWASPVEARLCEGQVVALVGGGNSAGQAVAFLAPRVEHLHLIVRGPGLEASMSKYLIERIAALPNVTIHTHTEVVGLNGERATGLAGAVLRDRRSGEARDCALRHLFLFVGADPNTDWLKGCVATDDRGFIVTGGSALPLETNRAGVFAIGDVRAGSTKRVAAAVGEGAAVVAQIHQYLADG